VVVLADRPAEAAGLRIRRSGWPRARVVRVVAATDEQTHERLAVLRHLDLVIDARRSDDGRQLETFRRCFFHLGPKGAWVALRSSGTPAREPLVELAEHLKAGNRVDGDPWSAHARGSRRIRVTPGAVVVGVRQRHLLRVAEDELPLLTRREPALGVTTLATLPGGSIEVGHLLHEYGATPEPRLPDVLDYPTHTLRRYQGRLLLPGSTVVRHRRTVLPDSFRWHLTSEPEAPGLPSVDEHFSRLRRQEHGARLAGSYFFLAYANTGHFGHLMTEALSKLWGWWPAKEADPSLRLLCRLHPTRGDVADARLENVLLPALGISRDDIVWVDGPVEVDSLVGCTPMWHNAPPFYFHPALRQTWDRLRTGILGGDPPAGPDRKIFITRRVGGRPCANVDEVEELFAAHGFAVVSPERLSIPEQAALFASAEVVAGLGGSGMFNLAYAQRVRTVIVLNHWAYQARNEHLFAAAHGAELHCFWSPPDADHPDGGFSYDAHQGAWAFDMAANGAALTELLTRLPG
jgi:capsular polysaccharide biosynthesis protein